MASIWSIIDAGDNHSVYLDYKIPCLESRNGLPLAAEKKFGCFNTSIDNVLYLHPRINQLTYFRIDSIYRDRYVGHTGLRQVIDVIGHIQPIR